ncbi:MAG: VCBS repeat-containing protein [Tepidisphaeraceae bacterium]
MSCASESPSVYGKALGVGLAGLAGLAAEGALTAPARANVATYDLKALKKVYDAPDLGYFKFGINVAAGDLDGDGRAEIIASGNDGTDDVLSFLKFDGRALSVADHKHWPTLPATANGLRVATGDLNGDGLADLVVGDASGAGSGLRAGGGPYIKITLSDVVVSGYSTPMTNGVHVALADTDGDGQAEIFTGPSASPPSSNGVPPATSTLRRNSITQSKGRSGDLTSYMKYTDEFAVYGSSFTGGIRVATGDVDGDGVPDIVTMEESGVARHINYTKIKYLVDPGTGEITRQYDKASPVLARSAASDEAPPESIAVADLDGDGRAELIIGAAPGARPQVDVFSLQALVVNNALGGSGSADGWVFRSDLSLNSGDLPFGAGYTGGVNVAAGDVTGDGFMDLIVANASLVPEPGLLTLLSATALPLMRRRRSTRSTRDVS